MKNGVTSSGRQRWRCRCGASQTNRKHGKTRIAQFTQFQSYLAGKYSQREIAGNTARTLRRSWAWCWTVPIPPLDVTGEVYEQVFIDGIYLAYGWCLIIARNSEHVISWQWCTRENTASYQALLTTIAPPDVATTDGDAGALRAIKDLWPDTKVQRCLLHVHRNTIRDLTRHPATEAGKALLGLSKKLLSITTLTQAAAWEKLLIETHTHYEAFLKERTYARDVPRTQRRGNKTWWYTHERDRRVHMRLAHLVRENVLFTYLGTNPVSERTTNPIESLNARIRSLTNQHRGLSETHMLTMIDWYLYTLTENPRPATQILTNWNQEGQPVKTLIPTKRRVTNTHQDTGIPVHYDTALTAEEGLWTRKGWAGRSQ